MNIFGVIAIVIGLCLPLVSGHQCPTWFVLEKDKCVCGQQINTLLQCSNATNKTKILHNYCLTYNNDTEHFGACPYNTNSISSVFINVPSDVSKLDEEMCGPLNRTGLLCSHCQPGLGPAVFSYYRECKECLPHPYGWLLYFVRLLVPLTLLCVLIIVFRVSFFHPVLNSFVIAAQMLNVLLFNDAPFLITRFYNHPNVSKLLADVIGIFNLDFFIFLLPSFCISENMNTLTVIAMEYLVALYPILFTLVIYWLITLHDRGCKIVVNCWRPFHKCLARCRKKWELKGSVVKAFATFFMLSYSKFCSISFHLLKPVPLYNKHGYVKHTLFFAADFDIGIYIPLAILASIITIFMLILPAIFLLCYQNRFFQRYLYSCKIQCTLIHELANISHEYFKNGTSKATRDCRWFATIYLLMRIIFIAASSQRYNILVYLFYIFLVIVLLLGVRPYKKDGYNYLDSFLLGGMAMVLIVYLYQIVFQTIQTFLKIVAIGIAVVYALLLLSWGIYSAISHFCASRCYRWKVIFFQTRVNEDNESLPHRISNPNEYESLIAPTRSL